MISHLADCIEKKSMVGYGGLLTHIFKKFGVPLDGLEFPMSANNKIGAKCLNNLHLKLNDKGILEDAIEEVEEVSSDDEKEGADKEEEEKVKEGEEKEMEGEEEQETVPSASTDKAEVNEEEGRACTEGEASKEEVRDELEEEAS